MKILFTSLILCLSIASYCQLDFIEVRIQQGLTVHGTTSYKLLKEGFVYRIDGSLYGIKEEIKFIPFYKLDMKKVYEIQKYVLDMHLYDIENIPIPDSIIINVSNSNAIRVSFIQIDEHLYRSFLYRHCDERIDTLIKLMNELIPPKERKKFSILTKC